MDNFTPIRNGLGEHMKNGRMSPFDVGVYVFLQMHANWATGIYHGCALTIAFGFNDQRLKENVQKSLRRLRSNGYINFRKGDGTRGGYPILLNKYEPRIGELTGKRLDAWKHKELCLPAYEPKNSEGTVEAQWSLSDGSVEAPIQEVQELRSEEVRSKNKPTAPDGACERIYQAYPRHVGREAALKAIAKALTSIQEQKQATAEDAAEFLYSQVVKFSNSPAGQRGAYTPHCSSWMNSGRYFDDPNEWHRTTPNTPSGRLSYEDRAAEELRIAREFAARTGS